MGLIGEIKVMATCTFDNGEKFTGVFYAKTLGKGLWKEAMALQIKKSLNTLSIRKKCVHVRVH